MSDITSVDRTNFDEEVVHSDLPIVVMFRADWSEIGEELAPVFEELASEYAETVRAATIEIEENGRLCNDLNIAEVPTVFGYHEGNSLKRKAGDVTADDLEEIFDYLASLPALAA
mgnify:CR=1 FL=1